MHDPTFTCKPLELQNRQQQELERRFPQQRRGQGVQVPALGRFPLQQVPQAQQTPLNLQMQPAGQSSGASNSSQARRGKLTQADLIEQVIEYLVKKGYSKTEASLRAETQAEAAGERTQLRNGAENTELYLRAFRG